MDPQLSLYDETNQDNIPETTDTIWIPPELVMDEVRDLAAGIVPQRLQVMAMRTLDWEDHLRRNAEKPDRNVKVRV